MTDTKLTVNLELREKFTQWKKTREFHDNESENISGESIEGAAIIRGRRLLTFLSQMRRLIEGGGNSSKYGIAIGFKESKCLQLPNPNWILYVNTKVEFFMYLYIFRVKNTFSVYGVMSLLMLECGLFSYRL